MERGERGKNKAVSDAVEQREEQEHMNHQFFPSKGSVEPYQRDVSKAIRQFLSFACLVAWGGTLAAERLGSTADNAEYLNKHISSIRHRTPPCRPMD